MQNSFELLLYLKNKGYKADLKDDWWWPNSGTFEVLVGVVLVQQTKWEKVEVVLDKLRINGYLNFDNFILLSIFELERLVSNISFYKTKATRLFNICKNIKEDFDNFETFKNNVDKEWLLGQKGIGQESADSILCYLCKKEHMVCDSYTNRLLAKFGYEFQSYDDLQEWLVCGLDEHWSDIENIYGIGVSKASVYARFHGKIVEYMKSKLKK